MSCLFSKAQNHLCREPDGHGARGASHADLRSLGRPHSLHHLEDLHPEHQQRRKGMTSPKSFRALGCPLKASRVCPTAAEPEDGMWSPATTATSRGLRPAACTGRGTASCTGSQGCDVSGCGQGSRPGEEEDGDSRRNRHS